MLVDNYFGIALCSVGSVIVAETLYEVWRSVRELARCRKQKRRDKAMVALMSLITSLEVRGASLGQLRAEHIATVNELRL